MTYGSETMPLLVDFGLKFERTEMQMIRWMCGISMKDKRTSEELRRMVGVELLLLLSTHSLDPCLWGESDHPDFGPPASLSGQQLHHSSGVCPQIQW